MGENLFVPFIVIPHATYLPFHWSSLWRCAKLLTSLWLIRLRMRAIPIFIDHHLSAASLSSVQSVNVKHTYCMYNKCTYQFSSGVFTASLPLYLHQCKKTFILYLVVGNRRGPQRTPGVKRITCHRKKIVTLDINAQCILSSHTCLLLDVCLLIT